MNKRRIYRQGNSLVVSLPPALLHNIGLREGDHVSVCLTRDNYIHLQPIHSVNGVWHGGSGRDSIIIEDPPLGTTEP